jgi:hypothetical protein
MSKLTFTQTLRPYTSYTVLIIYWHIYMYIVYLWLCIHYIHMQYTVYSYIHFVLWHSLKHSLYIHCIHFWLYTDNIPRVYCVHMYFFTFTQTLVYLVKSVYSVYSDVLIIYVHCIYTYILYTNHYISIYTFDYICTVYSAYTVFISVYVLFDIHSNTHCIH